jgi:hypothetical protein
LKQTIGRRLGYWRVSPAGAAAGSCSVGCMAQLRLPFQPMRHLPAANTAFVCVNSNNERRTAVTAKYIPSNLLTPFLASSSPLSLLLLFTHHLLRSSQYLTLPYPHASSHPATTLSCIALFHHTTCHVVTASTSSNLDPASSLSSTIRPAQ